MRLTYARALWLHREIFDGARGYVAFKTWLRRLTPISGRQLTLWRRGARWVDLDVILPGASRPKAVPVATIDRALDANVAALVPSTPVVMLQQESQSQDGPTGPEDSTNAPSSAPVS